MHEDGSRNWGLAGWEEVHNVS